MMMITLKADKQGSPRRRRRPNTYTRPIFFSFSFFQSFGSVFQIKIEKISYMDFQLVSQDSSTMIDRSAFPTLLPFIEFRC